jgi:hypothetical protein
MTVRISLLESGVLLLAAALAIGCSDDETSSAKAPTVKLPSFSDITAAPANIQTAARAVVRLRVSQGAGTGSFISSTGLILTNNHILGNEVCPIEGCYVEVSSMHQRGTPYSDPVVRFAVPQAVDVGLDMAIAQLYTEKGGSQLNTPNFLQFNPQQAEQLIGTHVNVVGHPEAHLKKWTEGTVVDSSGQWFIATAYILPGNSGSPLLDDQGQIVGLIHRGPTGQDLFTDVGVNEYSVGTASGPLTEAMNDPLPDTMLSVNAATTADAFVANNFIYLNAGMGTIPVSGVASSAYTLLASACDAALANVDPKSPDDLYSILFPCISGQAWIECRTERAAPDGSSCPSSAQAWVSRYQAVNQAWQSLFGAIEYSTVSFAIASLQPTEAAGVTAGAQSLQQALSASNPPLNFDLAYYLAAFNIDTYAGQSVSDYFVNYSKVAHYELSAQQIAYGITWLVGNGLTSPQVISIEKKLLNDPKVDVGTQLAIEDLLYQIGEL